MKRFLVILLSALVLVSICACGQKGYTEEEQKVIDNLYSLQAAGVSMQEQYDGWDEEEQELMSGVTEALYKANAREYAMVMSLLKMTSVVIPDDLPETLPDFQK